MRSREEAAWLNSLKVGLHQVNGGGETGYILGMNEAQSFLVSVRKLASCTRYVSHDPVYQFNSISFQVSRARALQIDER